MSIVSNPPTPVNGEKPKGCILFEPERKRAHFEHAADAWEFHLSHLGWRVTAVSDETPQPTAYGRLPGGLWCDAAARSAGFSQFRSAWLFQQLHPDWVVEWLSICGEQLEDGLYSVAPGDLVGLLAEVAR